MLLIWLGAILGRNQIRALWWTYRLESTTATEDRLFYFHRLASLKNRAAGPVSRLLEHPDPALRSFAVAVLHQASGPEVAQLLADAAHDADDDVRRSALLGLALNGTPPAMDALAQHLHGPDERTGMIAAAALVGAPSPAARDMLRNALRQSPHPGVRLEAINALEQLRALDAVDALIAALTDHAVFQGVTESDRTAMQMLEAARDQGLPDSLDPNAALQIEQRHVVAHCAERTLRRLTGHDVGIKEAENRWDEVISAWRAWLQAQPPPSGPDSVP